MERATRSKARLRFDKGSGRRWLFLPGGPGLGSESLSLLVQRLSIEGALWRLDLPGDGSNLCGAFSDWQTGLLEAVEMMAPCVLVAHSTGGMYALSTPGIEKSLVGLALLDSAPDARFHDAIRPEADAPTDDASLKAVTLAAAPQLFMPEGLEEGTEMLRTLPYCWEAWHWSAAHFDRIYRAAYVPRVPTLLLAGEQDLLTPLSLFGPSFTRKNILRRSIPRAGHFPWIDNPQAVCSAIEEWSKLL